MVDLPNPRDRGQPWWGADPAYLAHYRARMATGTAAGPWDELVKAYAEAIPTSAALSLLADFAPMVEVGAGSGYWARLLKDLGVDVIAYDPMAPERNDWTAKLPGWTELQEGDAVEAVEQHPNRTLFACWPPRPHGYMDDVLPMYDGLSLALITDGRFCPGEDVPDPLYDRLERDWICERELDLPHWPGRYDRLMIWRRRGTS
jgi:hypothetical protein